MKSRAAGFLLMAALLMTAFAACGDEPDMAEEPGEMEEEMAETSPDTTGAALWAHLQSSDYTSWPLWPDKGAFYTGQEPHGMLLTTYLNEAAYAALSGDATMMPEGAIIVKENYMPDSTLAAVTVMYKVPGYNPMHNDWFFTKHLPDGMLDKSPEGMALEGRLAGCQNCHTAQKANDYLFTGPLAAGGM